MSEFVGGSCRPKTISVASTRWRYSKNLLGIVDDSCSDDGLSLLVASSVEREVDELDSFTSAGRSIEGIQQ